MQERLVVVSLNESPADIAPLQRQFPEFTFVQQPHRGPFDEELVARAEILATQGRADMIRAAQNAKWIHTFSAGVDGLFAVLAESHPQGVPLTNGAGVYGIPIAEHSLALLMALSHRLDICTRNMAAGNWRNPGAARELCGATVGILGTGDIGTHLAQMVTALGAHAVGYKRRQGAVHPPYEAFYYGDDGLDEMLPLCDYICICLPGTPHTRGLLDARRMQLLKPGVIITNIGRGYIMDTEALLQGLRTGHIGGAGLDVTDPEPLPADHPLWQQENVIITPHCASSSPLAVQRKVALFARNMQAYLTGQPLPNLVDSHWEY